MNQWGSHMQKEQMILEIEKNRLIILFRKIPKQITMELIDGFIRRGIHIFEITMDSDDALDIIRECDKTYFQNALIGAGTILTKEHAEEAISAGAKFLVSPHINRDAILLAHQQGVLSIPGCLTPTEMVEADQLGADFIKLFPASAVGPNFIREIKGPLPHLKIIPSGGVHRGNMIDLIQSGASAVGIGGGLMKKDWIQNRKFDQIFSEADDLINLLRDMN